MIVLTDGQETASKYIADVTPLLTTEHVFAIGMGTAEQVQPAALNALTNGTGGYLLMTDAMGDDDLFRLTKYYLQILAGVTNTDIVLDPEGYLHPGDVHRIPFHLNETDISSDVILLSPAAYAIDFRVETPDGELIDPAIANSGPGSSFTVGSNMTFYRFTLPVPIGKKGAGSGKWHAVLSYRGRKPNYTHGYDNYPNPAGDKGLRYSLNVHAYSNIRMKSRITQDSMEPGAKLTLRSVLTEYGMPLEDRAHLKAELKRPDNTQTVLNLAEVEPGVFEASTPATMSGIYHFRILADGSTMRGTLPGSSSGQGQYGKAATGHCLPNRTTPEKRMKRSASLSAA